MRVFSLIIVLIQSFLSWMHRFIARPAAVLGQDNFIRTVVMTTTSIHQKRALRTYKDLPDMSIASELGRMVRVAVGYEAREFQVHVGRLGPLAKLLEGSPEQTSASISLPKEKPETFNAVVNWMYNETLPRAGRPSEYIDETKSLTPTVPSTNQAPYLTWIGDFSSKYEPEKPASLDDHLEDAHATQCMLLDIMMLAERYDWEKLYNAAIDAFREGEANLVRDRPSMQHIEVVYRRTTAGSPIRQFLGDYAYSLARANKDITWYWHENWFRKIPEFLEDMLKRVDGNGPFQYPFERRAGKDSEDGGDSKDGQGSGKGNSENILTQEAPLELSATTYHIHGGRMELDCERSKEGICVLN
ncbi:hypothetical protein F5Y09DRAFT_353516 [Xylaria sp. FL1042]|nr:hypothetical protein F5Y09DRAFT_353516 [Xylaria sp. FL1042]